MHNHFTIIGMYLIVVAMGLTISWHIFNTADKVYAGTNELVNKNIPSVRAIEQIRGTVSEYERVLYEYYATTDQQQAQANLYPVIEQFKSANSTINESLQLSKEFATLNRFFNRMQSIAAELDKNLGHSKINWDLAREQLKQISAYGRAINIPLDALVKRSEAQAQTSRQNTLHSSQSMKISVAAYALVICVIAGLVTFFINRYLVAATERRKAEQQLRHLALFDNQTGLPNRHSLERQLATMLAYTSAPFAIALIQLDRLQRISNSYGYNTVDNLISATAIRVQQSLTQADVHDTLYRFGGSTLALLVPNCDNEKMQILGEQLKKSFDDPVEINDGPFYLTLSIGYSRYPQDGNNTTHLIKNADTALTRILRQNGNGLCAYNQDMYIAEQAWIELEKELEHALTNNELMLFYQPKVDSKTLRTTGVEALIRWKKKDQSFVSPDAFIPLAEQTGLILQIGDWVIREACRQVQLWLQKGHHHFVIAINISARQFQHHHFVPGLKKILADANIPPEFIELEITESLIMQDINTVIETLNEVKSLGISLAIDDFGTGHSSLSYLSQFPIDKLKIDKSFVQDIEVNTSNLAIVRTVIDLAHHLNLSVVAEGVETQEQLNLLKQYNCEEIQGFYISRPLPAQELHPFLNKPVTLQLAH